MKFRPISLLLCVPIFLILVFSSSSNAKEMKYENFEIIKTKATIYEIDSSKIKHEELNASYKTLMIGIYSRENLYYQIDEEPLMEFENSGVFGKKVEEIDVVVLDFGDEYLEIENNVFLYGRFVDYSSEEGKIMGFYDRLPRELPGFIGIHPPKYSYNAEELDLENPMIVEQLVSLDSSFTDGKIFMATFVKEFQDDKGQLKEDFHKKEADGRANFKLKTAEMIGISDLPVNILSQELDTIYDSLTNPKYEKKEWISRYDSDLNRLIEDLDELEKSTGIKPGDNESIKGYILTVEYEIVDQMFNK